ncbi:MAG: TrmH family RNA methyltransferase, partial [Paludibacteraceae bacterium]|nr:TrmH family RNA methyltransferase [Paludibacteraceae bacterium]
MQKLKVTEMNRLTVEEFKKKEKTPLIVVLDNVRSLHNVGSIFRTADAFLLQAVYLCGITSTPPNAELHKTALGAENSVEWIYFEETQKALEELHKEKYKIFAIEQARESLPLNTIQ